MNRTLRLVGMAAMVLLLAASCKKEKQNEEGLVMKTFSAGIAQNGNAKTGLIPEGDASTADGHYFKQVWLENDKINVNGNTFSIEPSSITPTTNGCTATFSGLVKPSEKYYAVYPVSENENAKLNGDGTATFVIPRYQEVTKTTTTDGKVMYIPNYIPMAASCEAGAEQLDFDNLCGLLELRFYCPDSRFNLTVSKITLRSNDSEHISGRWIYNFSDKSFCEDGTNGVNEIVMNFDSDIEVSHDPSNPTSFLFVVPPVVASRNFYVFASGNDVEGNYVSVGYLVEGDVPEHATPVTINAGEVTYNMKAIKLLPQAQISINNLQFNDDNSQVTCSGTVIHENCPVGITILEKGVVVFPSNGEKPTEYVQDERFHKDETTTGGYDITLKNGDGNVSYGVDYKAAGYLLYEYNGSNNEGVKVFTTSSDPKSFKLVEPIPTPTIN